MRIKWNEEKNTWLKENRHISFNQVEKIIMNHSAEFIEDAPHPNQIKYPNQRIFLILLNKYAHMVPYVREGDVFFLKTIIPSRKHQKQLLP